MKTYNVNLIEMYKKALDEDAMVAAAAGAGEVVSGSASSDGIVSTPTDSGITNDEVLGNCDHHKDGYLGPKCFHVPSRTNKKLKKRIPTTDYKF